MTAEVYYMRKALELARRGRGMVSPNPLVGAVLVRDGRVIGAGYHESVGSAHAEINALNSAAESVAGATLYVTLEPCCVHGRTPPCVDAILNAGITRVVYGMRDPNPAVCGQGVDRLAAAGVEVIASAVVDECKAINAPYIKYVTSGQPYVLVKIAQTLDGRIATKSGDSRWVTGSESRRYVHDLRAELDAVLVGHGTVVADDPALTVRECGGRNPQRIVLDQTLSCSSAARVFSDDLASRTIVVCSERCDSDRFEKLRDRGVRLHKVAERDGLLDLAEVMRLLPECGVCSVLVEGGAQVFTSFVRAELFDRMLIFIAPKIVGQGLDGIGDLGLNTMDQALRFSSIQVSRLGDDYLFDISL